MFSVFITLISCRPLCPCVRSVAVLLQIMKERGRARDGISEALQYYGSPANVPVPIALMCAQLLVQLHDYTSAEVESPCDLPVAICDGSDFPFTLRAFWSLWCLSQHWDPGENRHWRCMAASCRTSHICIRSAHSWRPMARM